MSGFIALSGAQLVNSATAQAQQAPYNPIASYTDYNVVSFGDLHIKAESEGAVAVGGNFSFTGSQTIIKKQAPVALVVKGGVDWGRSTGNHQVNPQNSVSGNPLSINLEGSQALDKDSNGANAQVQVVPQGAGYGSDLRIQLNDNGPKADAVAYDAAKYDSLFDKKSAITASERLDQESKNECQAPFTLQKVESQNNLPPGIEPPAYFIQGGSQAWLYLKAGQQNILNLTAEELSQISEFQIKGAPISKDTPLFINVTGKNVNFNLNSFDVAVAPYILWNLPEATQVTQSGDSLRGSLLAPMAKLDKTGGNIDGTVIVDSGDMKGSEQHYAPFEGLFTPCGDEPTPVKPEIATNAGAEGEDHVKVISADGGALVDQVAYSGLVPGKEYTLEGEIHDPQGNATGITAKTTFTPETADGSVEVKFEITAANATKYAGKSLVVYETLKEGKGGEGSAPIAEHHDPNDKAQSFTVEEEKPTPVEPLIGTSAAVQGVDDVKVLPVSGGTVVDTVSYENLEPETEYTLAGELVHVGADNQVIEKTGITGSGEFKTAAAADGESVVSGSAEVAFEISAEAAAKYAGEKLVVFEKLSLDGEVVVTHEDPTDVKQSFTVEEEKPTPVEPLIGASAAVQGVDDVKVLPVSGGTVVDTVSYENLEPETEYTLAGELV
ncbi:VaFE repeat-containing surface-anchored protein, partial [Corynebacterium striatum]|uniref:VaFE repeat-containing surface-anchored protein n=1 Tax=Corynebacterium striatum TaxID=43770 RepID=UPI003B5C1D00